MTAWLERNAVWILLALAALILIATIIFAPWLNTNSGAVQGGAVAVLVLVTAFYAWQTKAQADASVKMAEEMRAQRYNSVMPILVPTIEPRLRDHMQVLPHDDVETKTLLLLEAQTGTKVVWKNVGVGPALNVEFSFIGIPLESHPDKAMVYQQRLVALALGESIPIEASSQNQRADHSTAGAPRIMAEYKDVYKRSFKSFRKLLVKTGDRGDYVELGDLEIEFPQ